MQCGKSAIQAFGRTDPFKDLQQEYTRIIEAHQVPYAENIKALSDWLIYVCYGRLIAKLVPEKEARIIDWGGLYGQVTKILIGLGYPNVSKLSFAPHPALSVFFERPSTCRPFGVRTPITWNWRTDPLMSLFPPEYSSTSGKTGSVMKQLILREVYRVLKTGGLFFIWNLPSRWGSSELLARAFNRWHHAHCFRRKEILGLLGDAGFRIFYMDKHKFLPGTVMEWLGRRIDPVRVLQGDDRLSHWFPFHLLARDYALIAKKTDE